MFSLIETKEGHYLVLAIKLPFKKSVFSFFLSYTQTNDARYHCTWQRLHTLSPFQCGAAARPWPWLNAVWTTFSGGLIMDHPWGLFPLRPIWKGYCSLLALVLMEAPGLLNPGFLTSNQLLRSFTSQAVDFFLFFSIVRQCHLRGPGACYSFYIFQATFQFILCLSGLSHV